MMHGSKATSGDIAMGVRIIPTSENSRRLPEPMALALGRKLNELRHATGLSIDDVAEQAGIDKTTVYRIDIGERVPSMLMLAQLCRVYAVRPSDVLSALDKFFD